MQLSTSALIDGLIHFTAFLTVCGLLYGFLLLIARSRFERNFFRTVFLVVSLVTARLYLLQGEWATTSLVIGILFILSFVLLVGVLRTDLIVTLITPFVLVPLLLGMEHAAFSFSKKVISDGITYAEFSGQAQSAVERSRRSERQEDTGAELRDAARRGLDALASLTTRREMDAMKKDFSRGVSLFAERKEWMDSLSPAEKQAYRAEMSAFLAEQGLAEDRYSLQAIREVNPTNLVVLASLFNELQGDGADEEERIRSIPESLAVIAANLRGMELSGDDLAALRAFSELFAKNEIEDAVAMARAELQASGGMDELAGIALAAMLQSKSGLPVDQLLADHGGSGLFAFEGHPEPPPERKNTVPAPAPVPAITEAYPVAQDTANPYVEISCPLGVVLIPEDSPDIEEWIVAAQAIEIKGYASLGDEIAILRKDGSVCVKGDDLVLEYDGMRYHFNVISILRDRVALQVDYVEATDAAMRRFF